MPGSMRREGIQLIESASSDSCGRINIQPCKMAVLEELSSSIVQVPVAGCYTSVLRVAGAPSRRQRADHCHSLVPPLTQRPTRQSTNFVHPLSTHHILHSIAKHSTQLSRSARGVIHQQNNFLCLLDRPIHSFFSNTGFATRRR